ncbi:MAG: hypothetical protein U0103_06730 [Candidatus Obscuribacterales bacterium]
MVNLDFNGTRPHPGPGVEEPPLENWAEELHQKPQHRKIWEAPIGSAVMMTGVVLPSLFLALFAIVCHERISMLLIKHPIETLVEVILALAIPIANFSIWSSICRKDVRFAMRRGLCNGISIGSSFLFVAVSVAAICMGRVNIYFLHEIHSFAEGFAVIACTFFLSMLSSLYLAYRLRALREFKSARLRTTLYSAVGVFMALLGFVGAEAKSVYMRVAQHMAYAGNTHQEQLDGLKMLRWLNAEQDMRVECADARTVGLPGLFIPINTQAEQQLYFAAFGKPFRDDRSTDLSGFSNDYLRRHVVGAMIPELSLVRSGMDGAVNADALSSTLNWTFVFKNTAYDDKEARAEFSLPSGAVISNVTVWKDGQPVDATFAPSGKAPRADSFTAVGHDTPAVVSDLGRGRTLLHCYPVKAQDELKVRMTMVLPLKLDKADEATLALPRFIDTNFAVNGEHQVRLRSSDRLSLKLGGLRESLSPTGERILVGSMKNEELSGPGVSVTAARKPTLGAIAVAVPNKPGRYFIESIQAKPVKVPNHLVVVLDGSQNVKSDLAAIKAGLSKLPSSMTSSLILASDVSPKLQELQPLASGLPKLTVSDFDGGQDNLQAVVKAASTAGETKDGAILWIHGPQPTLNRELYVMAPYIQTPAFYELALDNGVTDGIDFFKNHREIGPFVPVPRNGSIENDLARFVSRWQPGGVEYIVKLYEQGAFPKTGSAAVGTPQEAAELGTLLAKEQSQALIARGNYHAATVIAVRNRLVTPVSSAVVLMRKVSDEGYVQQGSGTVASSNTASDEEANKPAEPALAGVTNGSVSSKSEALEGVNTSGTVRVNNLANLEALLNILANSFEIVGFVYGMSLTVQALLFRTTYSAYFGMKGASVPVMVITGLLVTAAGLACPGVFNWFVASARDANLFS